MEKYGTDVIAETRAAISELERRVEELSKTADAGGAEETRDRLAAARARLKEFETKTV